MNANRTKIWALVLVILLIWGCVEIIDLEIPQTEPKLVIEGRLLNEHSLQTIEIYESLNFHDTTDLAPHKDARVNLMDQQHNVIHSFIYSNEDSLYKTTDSIELIVGQIYILQIIANGETLEAKGEILENATLDSLFYLSAEELKSIGQPVYGDGYFLFVTGSLNNEGIEYFKLDITVNGYFRNGKNDFTSSILSSEFFGREFQALPIPGTFEEDDNVILEFYTINEDVYQYFDEFRNLFANDGGVFSPPPVNPQTNIRNLTNPNNEPLGYIQFSAVQRRNIIIEKKD
ncbi:DUF4249 family protein [Marivirga sp.]|uniref:DUF4249 family protein n=1 Tax=Marivirga sp. TaxID=2018662 RepID=UPI002D7FABBA|nr:DUF4249 family protein [Marivirga sp.]HET8859489.1 DUF4249 family protein [Marivirga sp.]